MKVLLVGAAGFTGRRLLPLLAQRARVRCLLRPGRSRMALGSTPAEVIYGDMGDPAAMERSLGDCQGLICVASLGFGHAPELVKAVEQAGLQRAVYTSTTSIFTKLNPASKKVRLEAEEIIRGSTTPWSIVRPTMIYGEKGDRNMYRLLRHLSRYRVLAVPGDGQNLQQPVHVHDLAQAIVDCYFQPEAAGRAYNLSGAHPLPFNQVVAQAGRALGIRPRLVHLPPGPILAMLRLYEKAVPRPHIKAEQILRLQEDKAFDHGRAVRDFGFSPRPFAQGIRQEAMETGLRRC